VEQTIGTSPQPYPETAETGPQRPVETQENQRGIKISIVPGISVPGIISVGIELE